jgi:predicted nucleic acid-binding protein
MRIVLDTNILISAMVKKGFTRDFIIKSKHEFLTPAYTLSEINKYKEDICKKGNLDNKSFFLLLEIIFKYAKILNPIYYYEYMEEANKIIGHIHITDIVFIATALAFNCPIWSDDKHFQKQKQIKIFTTKDILDLE